MRSLVGVTTVAFFSVVGLLAGCGEDGGGSDATGSSDQMSEMGGGHEGASPVAEDARHVAVTARSFEFEPAELTAEVGEDVAIVLSSEDGLHDFTIDELDAHVAAEEGETSVGGFRAAEPGRYTFYCSVEGHREAGMEGTLVVEA
ncbi:MAG: cupredoxin domain-containing protein [Ilumatobacteraceae bacterium]